MAIVSRSAAPFCARLAWKQEVIVKRLEVFWNVNSTAFKQNYEELMVIFNLKNQ